MRLPPGVTPRDLLIARAYGDVVYLRGAKNLGPRDLYQRLAHAVDASYAEVVEATRRLRRLGLWDHLGPLPDLLIENSWHLRSHPKGDDAVRGRRAMEWTEDMDRRLIELRGMGRTWKQIRDDMGLENEYLVRNRAQSLLAHGRWPKDDPFAPKKWVGTPGVSESPVRTFYQCMEPSCGASFPTSEGLRSHASEAHRPAPSAEAQTPEEARPKLGVMKGGRPMQQGETFACTTCGNTFPDPASLKAHGDSQHGEHQHDETPQKAGLFPLPESIPPAESVSISVGSRGEDVFAALWRACSVLGPQIRYDVHFEAVRVDEGGDARA